VAIAGILAMEPECIIFDEPTAMLDPSGREEIMKAIRYLNRERGITIIYITHHTREVEDADYLYVMNQGKVVMAGEPADLWRQTYQLKHYQIGLPFVQELIDQLRLKGMDIPAFIRDKDGLLDYIFRKSDGSSDSGVKKSDVCSGQREKKSDKCTGQGNMNKLYLAESENDLKHTDLSAGIRLDHISYSYKSKNSAASTPALKDISLAIRPGEYAAIVGQTGSGKSTLLTHLNGLLAPSEGKYYFDGEEVHSKGYPIRRLRQKVALCFHYPEYQLFEESVLKDIAFGPKNMGMSQEEAERKAREAMKLTGLSEDLETISPFVLSGGQKRRVALAGILAMEPDYLILDEPAAGLDQEGKERLFDLLDKLQSERNVTIILVSHDMEDVAAHARRVIVMKEGELLMDGPPEEIFAPEREDILKSAGLAMPEYLEFYNNMKLAQEEAEISLPLTIDQLADYILLSGNRINMTDQNSKEDNQIKQGLDDIDIDEGED
ncbi:MAG: energy-coupling factor transporter ATPase, partial [Eubacterium sp.]|nr:energy-coupling factor transporter ATPase [Eubacterium sp.]